MTKTSWVWTGGMTLSLLGAIGAGCTINSTSGTGSGAGQGGAGNSSGNGNNGSGAGSPTSSANTSSSGYGGGYGGDGGAGVGPTSVGTGPLPTDCTAQAADDTCTSCAKQQCCTEIQACTADANCPKAYQDFNDCLYPGGTWSGYDTNYCKAAVGADSGTLAGNMIGCFTDNQKCGVDGKCGQEVQDKWADFAAPFVEHFCAGCHVPGYVSDGGVDTADFSTDSSWSNDGTDAADLQSGGKADWFNWMSYDTVVANNDLLWCGLVAPSDSVPSECDMFVYSQTQASESNGTHMAGDKRFPKAARFPPKGGVSMDHTGATLHCWWTDSADVANPGVDCQTPTDEERHRFISWIFNNNPQ